MEPLNPVETIVIEDKTIREKIMFLDSLSFTFPTNKEVKNNR